MCKRGACMHMDTCTHTHAPAYTNSHCNKVILWPAQVNKVQQRMWQEQKKMAQHLLANYQPEEARREETKEDRSTHTEIGGNRKMKRARKTRV